MNRRAIFFGGMAIVTVSIFFGQMIGTEKVFTFGVGEFFRTTTSQTNRGVDIGTSANDTSVSANSQPQIRS